MLRELNVRNLLLIEEARLEFAGGLNVLTGETGAGKTLLATAIGLLLGDRSRSGLVRPDAAEAWVEGIFDHPADLPPEVNDLITGEEPEIVLARRVWPDGRSRALINGRTSTVADLRAVAGHLLRFYGQHEHRKLALGSFQREVLDGSCPAGHGEALVESARLQEEARSLQRHIEQLSGGGDGAERELDLLRFEVEEIDAVSPGPNEAAELDALIGRLEGAEAIVSAGAATAQAISPVDDGVGAASLIASTERQLASAAEVDPDLRAMSERLTSVLAELEELARDLRNHVEGVDMNPQQLNELRERRDAISSLARKHGGSVDKVLEHAANCRRRIAELADLEGTLEGARSQLSAVCRSQDEVNAVLHGSRVKAARRLEADVEEALTTLALDGASFRISIEPGPQQTAHGTDSITFLIAPNGGMPPAPLGETASGGEMSRVLLALLTASRGIGSGASAGTVVFDEIDAGIGGRTARAVGERLRLLAGDQQVLCITHLAQVAALGERHFTVTKESVDGATRTTVEALSGDEVVDELVRMLGGNSGDSAARAHAVEMLEAA